MVQGDLLAFNVLMWEGSPCIIDFPQAVDPRFNQHAFDLLTRDVTNLCRYFARFGVDISSGHVMGVAARAESSMLATDCRASPKVAASSVKWTLPGG